MPEPTSPFPYAGPESLRRPIVEALARVVDPEVALSIVDVGLVYGVCVVGDAAKVSMTMTSPACPVADLIIEDVENELAKLLPADCRLDVELCWEPAWSPDRMSDRAKRFMRW